MRSHATHRSTGLALIVLLIAADATFSGEHRSPLPLRTVAYRQQAAAAKRREARVGWTFRDVDVQTLLARLKRFGVEVPVPLEGRVTVRLSATAPWRSVLRPGSYQVAGELNSDRLTVAGVPLSAVKLHLVYTEGSLQLTDMSFALPGKDGPGGTVSGTARMQVRPRGDLTAELSIDEIALATLAEAVPELAGKATGSLWAKFNGRVAVDRLRDLSSWQAQGRLTLGDVAVMGLPPLNATSEFRLANGRATLTNLSAEIEGARLTASGKLNLASPYNFTSRVRIAVPDLAWINKLEADFRPPVDVAGSFSLRADADGSLGTKQIRARGALDGQRLKAGDVTIDRLSVPFDGTLDRIRLNSVRVDLYGGRITANFAVPTDLKGNIGAGVRLRDVDLGALAAAVLGQPQSKKGKGAPWRSIASGTLQMQAPADRLSDLDAWSGQGDLSLGQGNLFGIEVTQIATSLRVEKGQLNVSRLAVDSSLARVTGSLQLNLTTPFGFGSTLRIENVDFAQLNNLQDNFRLPVTVAGRAGISAKLQGALQPPQITIRGGVATRRLQAEGVTFDSLDLRYSAESGDDLRDPAKWQADLDANWSGVRLAQSALPRGSLMVRLADGTLAVSRFATEGGTMRVNGSGELAIVAPHAFKLKLDAENVDLSTANGVPASIRPPVQVAGTVTASADVHGQLDPPQVEGAGKVNLRNLRFAAAVIDSLGFNFSGNNNSVSLDKVSLAAYRGRLDGKVKVPLANDANGDLDLHWQQLHIGRMLTDVRGLLAELTEQTGQASLAQSLSASRFDGWTWGSINVQTPAGKLLDPTAWKGDVDVSLAKVHVFGFVAQKAFIRGTLADGQADLTRLAFDIDKTRLRGTASLKLSEPYDFQSDVSLENVDLGDLNRLPRALRPPVKLAGTIGLAINAAGKLQSLEITGNGSLTADDIEADGAKLDHLAIGFDAEKEFVELTRFHAELYGGTIEGTARVPLADDQAGKIHFGWKDFDIGRLVTDVGHLAIQMNGKVAGKIDVDIPAGEVNDIEAWTMDASFDTTPITAESARLGQLSGNATYRRGVLEYGILGSLLRGNIELAGRWQPKSTGEDGEANDGRLQLAGARLDALIPLFSQGSALSSLTGQINVNVRYQHDDKTGVPTGAGQLAIDDLRLDEVSLLDEIRGLVRVRGDRIEVANLQGLFAGGAVTASAVAFLDPARRGSFRADISSAEIAEALAPLPKLAAKVRGTFDAQLRGFFGGGRPVQVTGAVAAHHGRASGLQFDGVRVPLTGTLDPASGNGVIQVHGATGQIALGHFNGDFDVTLANGLNVKGHGKFNRVDLRTLLRQSASASRLANGKIDGVYTLAGRNVRSIADLTGTLNANLSQTQAMSLPVLQQTLPYLTGGVSGSTTFNEGKVRAHLTRAVIHVDRFTLSSGSVQIYADGTVSLAGRLDLNVIAKTGQLNTQARAVALLASRIALVVSPPVGLLMEATQFLSNQVINLDVTGTIRSPTIRIQPLQLLGQEAAQFFLYQAIP